jgi:Ca2+-binding EF-hand superfamily protein
MVGATFLFATTITTITDWIQTEKTKAKEKRVLNAALDATTLEDMDEDGDGKVTEQEFVYYMIIKSGKIGSDDLEEIRNQFHILDEDGSGELDKNDIERVTDKKIHETRTRLASLAVQQSTFVDVDGEFTSNYKRRKSKRVEETELKQVLIEHSKVQEVPEDQQIPQLNDNLLQRKVVYFTNEELEAEKEKLREERNKMEQEKAKHKKAFLSLKTSFEAEKFKLLNIIKDQNLTIEKLTSQENSQISQYEKMFEEEFEPIPTKTIPTLTDKEKSSKLNEFKNNVNFSVPNLIEDDFGNQLKKIEEIETFRIVIIGDNNVGKYSLFQTYTRGDFRDSYEKPDYVEYVIAILLKSSLKKKFKLKTKKFV